MWANIEALDLIFGMKIKETSSHNPAYSAYMAYVRVIQSVELEYKDDISQNQRPVPFFEWFSSNFRPFGLIFNVGTGTALELKGMYNVEPIHGGNSKFRIQRTNGVHWAEEHR